jgi:predicted dehydrogenase
MEAMWTRFLPAIQELLEILTDPCVGQIKMLIAGGAFKPQINPDYFLFRPELGGGVMADAGIYLVHLAHWLLGPPHSIAAHLSLGPFGADDHDAVLLDYANQAKALLYVSMRASQPPYAEILCEHACVRVAAPVFNPSAIEVVFAQGESKTWRFESSQHNYRFQIEEVVACLRNGVFVSPRMPPTLSLSVSRILSQIVSSAPSPSQNA